MDEVPNRDVGYTWMAYILGELHEAWPQRVDFALEEIRASTEVRPEAEDELVFDGLISFLADEGYIRTGQREEGVAYDTALTEKGFAALGKHLPGVNDTIGGRLKSLAGQGAAEAGKAAIADLVGRVIGSALSAYST